MLITKVGATILTAFAVAMLLALPVTVAAQASSTFIVPFERAGFPDIDDQGVPISGTGAFLNPCTLEFVDVFGSSAITISQTVDKFGNTKVSVGTVTKGTGLGWNPDQFGNQVFSLNNYTFRDTQSITVKEPPLSSTSQAFESDFFDKIAMKGAKATDNWMMRARFRLRIAADGTVTVDLIRVTEGDGCRG
jgi:hypothetical protein